jgi:putative membrane protein
MPRVAPAGNADCSVRDLTFAFPRRSPMTTTCAIAAAGTLLLLTAMPISAAQQTADKQKQTSTSSMSKSDQRYFDDLARANLAEIQSGKLAQSKTSSAEVKQFAQHMIDDHGKKFDEQRTLARAKNIALPAAPEDKHKDAMKKLERLSGAQFDRAYMEQMVKDHEEAVRLVQNIATKADDPELKAAGQKALPDIQKHLEMAKSLAASTKNAKVSSSR